MESRTKLVPDLLGEWGHCSGDCSHDARSTLLGFESIAFFDLREQPCHFAAISDPVKSTSPPSWLVFMHSLVIALLSKEMLRIQKITMGMRSAGRGCSCCILRAITICSNLNPCAIRYLHNAIHNHQPFTSLLLQCHQMTKSKHIIRYKQPSTEGVTLRNESGYIITEGRGNNFIN